MNLRDEPQKRGSCTSIKLSYPVGYMLFLVTNDGVPLFRIILIASVILRVALILYSEWHDAHSVVKYTDIDYRVFSDATTFLLHPSYDNYARGRFGHLVNLGE